VSSCVLCGREILESDQRQLHAQVVGWRLSRLPSSGLRDARLTGALAHEQCVKKQKKGEPGAAQDSLFT